MRTGLEPATPCVTGRYSNQLNYRTVCLAWRGVPRFCVAKLRLFLILCKYLCKKIQKFFEVFRALVVKSLALNGLRREGRGAGAAGRLGEGRGAEAEEGAEDGFAGVVFAAQVGDSGMGGEACGECGGDGGGDA